MADRRPPTTETRRLVLIGPAYPFRGGIAHFLETTAAGLRARGHEVTVVTFTTQYPEMLFPGKTQFEEGGEGHSRHAERLLNSVGPASWWQTARHVIAARPDAIVFMHWMPFFAPAFGTVARLVRRQGIPSFAVVHNALPHERRPGDLALSRYFLRVCDGLVAMSDAVADDLESLGVTAATRRVPHPVYTIFGDAVARDDARSRLGIASWKPVLLFFGFIRRYKGLHVLLEAMPRVADALPDVTLVVAGEFYDDEQPYRDLIDRHGLSDHLVLANEYIPSEAVADYFCAADVVVQPYITATQSGVAQIAYQFDTPLIVTDVGGLAEVVPHEEAGLVVPPENPDALADAIIRFFREGLSERLTTGVRREKAKYSWDRLYDALEELVG